ncbi:MAG: hypothetical protein K8T90_22500, partial [Planctomycetes bacterium]|nr:hypothetical protein [Planctomycetota bacterium]
MVAGVRTRTLAAAILLATALCGAGRADDAPAAEAEPQSGSPAPVASQPATSQSATPPAAEAEPTGFTRTGTSLLEFHARGLDVAEAFAQLRRLMKKNIVVAPEVKAHFTGDLYDVTLPQAVDAICRSAGLMVREENGFLFVEPAAIRSRLFRLTYARAKDVVPLVQQLLSARGKISATAAAEKGIKANQDQAGGDDYAGTETLVVSDVPQNLDAIESAIRGLDARPLEILMEATIVAANVNDTTSMGVEFQQLEGIDFRGVGATSNAGRNIALGQLPAEQFDHPTANLATDMLSGIAKGGLSLGILKNDVAVFVRALQQVTDVHVMANPKVMVLNKQRGEVIVGRRDGYLTTTTTQTSTDQKVEFLETGTRLLFRPFIGEDGMVRLEIHPEDSNGGVTTAGLPFKETVEVTTNVLVPDGQTIVIGGLFRDRSVSTTNKVPVLGDIPLLGLAFRSTTDTVQRQEILILLTPRIVAPKRDAARGNASADASADAARSDENGGGVVVVDAESVRQTRADAAAAKAQIAAEREAAERALRAAQAERQATAAEAARAVAAARSA